MKNQAEPPCSRPAVSSVAVSAYDRYVHRLVRLAQTRLKRRYQSKLDPDDVVHSVFRTFYRRYRDGQIDIVDDSSLWALLARITVRKCTRKTRELEAQKRDVRRELSQRPDDRDVLLTQLSAREPTPEDAANLEDTMRQIMHSVDAENQQLIELKLQGYTNEEISAVIGRSERTIYRVLKIIRQRLLELENEIG